MNITCIKTNTEREVIVINKKTHKLRISFSSGDRLYRVIDSSKFNILFYYTKDQLFEILLKYYYAQAWKILDHINAVLNIV